MILVGLNPEFGLNNFNEPKILNETESIVNDILNLLFMRPGQFPSLPYLGIDISQYLYQFYDEIDTKQIKSKIASQCSEFLPYVNSGELDVIKTVMKNQPVLLIKVPTIRRDSDSSLMIGITKDLQNEIHFNWKFSDDLKEES